MHRTAGGEGAGGEVDAVEEGEKSVEAEDDGDADGDDGGKLPP